MNIWKTPEGRITHYFADEYVAACGDSGLVYLFECNAGNSLERYDAAAASGELLTADSPVKKRFFHPCNAVHEAPCTDVFMPGFIYATDGNDRKIANTEGQAVMIWIDEQGDIHCTDNLDRQSWQTNKS